MAEDLGQINVNKTVKKDPREALVEFMNMTAVARPSSIVTRPGQINEVVNNQQAKQSFMSTLAERVPIGMMAFAEGMGAGKPYSNYLNMKLEREKMAQDRELREAGLPMQKMLKTAEQINAAKTLGLLTDQQALDLLKEGEMLKEDVKTAVSAEKALTGTGQFMKQFERSYKELKQKFPDIGKEGLSGWIERKGASLANAFDELPETKAFQTEIEVLANKTARDIEGGRVTDADRTVYKNALASAIKHPSKTNVRLVSNALINLHNMGGDISKVIGEFSSSDTDIMKDIVSSVKKQTGIKSTDKIGVAQFGLNPDEWEMVDE